MSVAAQGRRIEAKNIYRFGFFVLAVAIGVSTLSARMLYMQVLQGQMTNSGGDTQPTETVTVPSARGLIYDASGAPLVRNVIDYAATVTPSDLPLDREQDVAAKLASILNMDPIYIVTQIDSAPGSMYEPVRIADGIDVKVARFIEENSDALPGVKIAVISKRQYLTPELFAEIIGYEGQITRSQLGSKINDTDQGPLSAVQYNKLKTLGYSGQDVVGQAGLEVQYEQALRGVYGTQKVGLDAAGKPIPGLAGQVDGKVAGSSLTLNIDTKEQKLAYDALNWGMTAANIQQGTIIVENPQNGKILAMVSLPSYNNQLFADGISETDFQKLLADKNEPLLNKALAQYAPGSTYKLVTATAGLSGVPAQLGSAGQAPIAAQQPAITTSDKLLSQPYIQIGTYKFWEWNKIGWGPLNIVEGISYSSDTFFYQLSELLGGPLKNWDANVAIDNLAYWARQYGFGAATGVDLPGEAKGIVPDTAWKKANKGEIVHPGEVLLAGIGQGFDASTPLQVLNAYCALANGGNLWTPQIVKSVTSPGGTPEELQPQLIRRLDITPQNLATLRQGMRDVVTTRHTGNLTDLPIKIAGKTGTAEFGVPDRAGNLPYHEWFVGWVPANPTVDDFTRSDSQLAVIAFVYGANTRGNVATEIVKYYMWKHFKLPGNLFSNPNLGYGGIDMYSLKPGLFYGRD